MKVVFTRAQKMSKIIKVKHKNRLLLTKFMQAKNTPPIFEAEEEPDPWTYLPGDDVLPNMVSGQTIILFSLFVLVAIIFAPNGMKKNLWDHLTTQDFPTLFYKWMRFSFFYLGCYLIGACITVTVAMFVEKTIFYTRNAPGLKEALTERQLNKLFFIFLKRMSAVGLIWPYSIYGYAYKFVFLQFFLHIFHQFMKA